MKIESPSYCALGGGAKKKRIKKCPPFCSPHSATFKKSATFGDHFGPTVPLGTYFAEQYPKRTDIF